MCHHKLPTTVVILLTFWYLILSSVAKMHAACSRSPHNVLHSPSTQDTNGTRSTVYTLEILSHRYLVGGVNEMLNIVACAVNEMLNIVACATNYLWQERRVLNTLSMQRVLKVSKIMWSLSSNLIGGVFYLLYTLAPKFPSATMEVSKRLGGWHQ